MRRVRFIAVRQVPPPQVAGLNTIRHLWIPAFAFAGMTILLVGGVHPIETLAAGPYTIDWYTIDGGGGTSSGGPYVLTGTIGQPDTGASKAGKYELLGGFWPGGGPVCTVEFDDLARFCDHWLETGVAMDADLDKNHTVDFVDYGILVDLWLSYCPNSWPLK